MRGRPDIAVAVGKLLTGYIELKAPGKGASPDKFSSKQDKDQWRRFKQIPNLIYTDGSEWALYRSGERIGKVISLTGDVTEDGAKAVSPLDVVNLDAMFADFLVWKPVVPNTPVALAEMLAPLCHMLREDVLGAVSSPASNLHQLAGEWRTALFPDADDAQFADAYAQTITYALLLARLSGQSKITPANAATTLDKGHGLLAQALRVLADVAVADEIGIGLELLERSIGAVDADALKKKSADLWLYFYEDFLAKYDPKLRKDRGAYYTPVEVVRTQTRLVSKLLIEKFNKAMSYADEGVTLLDPASGTGAYPVAAIQHGIDLIESKYGPGAVGGHASQLAQNTHAFEILVGPYAVSHLRISQQILDAGGSLPKDGVHVYLTDTLESPFAEPKGTIPLFQKKLAEEHKRARAVKEKTNILICIGNPPYDRQEIAPEEQGFVERKGGWVRVRDDGTPGILDDFLKPVRDAGAGIQLKNLYNDYVYFWRWAIWKVLEQNSGSGIVSFITASSFMRGKGFVGMRQMMRQLFDEIWFIDLEGSNAGARKTENVFAIETPVVITVGIRYKQAHLSVPASCHYAKLTGSKEEKLAILNTVSAFTDLVWQDCPSEWSAVFLPACVVAYGSWPKLTQIFPWQHSGVQYKRTWPIAETKELLERRWSTFTAMSPSEKAVAFRETRDRKITKNYRDVFSGEKLPTLADADSKSEALNVVPYGFRSFDRRFVLADSRLADFLRPVLWASNGPKQVFLTSLLSDMLGTGQSATVSSHVPDLHYFCNRGAKDVIPLWRDAAGTSNVTNGLLKRLKKEYETDATPEDLFAYCYAVLASPDYVKTFWDELATPGPRIPITKAPDIFAESVKLGRALIHLQTFGTRFIPNGKKANAIPEGKAKAIKGVSPSSYPETFEYSSDTDTLGVCLE